MAIFLGMKTIRRFYIIIFYKM